MQLAVAMAVAASAEAASAGPPSLVLLSLELASLGALPSFRAVDEGLADGELEVEGEVDAAGGSSLEGALEVPQANDEAAIDAARTENRKKGRRMRRTNALPRAGGRATCRCP